MLNGSTEKGCNLYTANLLYPTDPDSMMDNYKTENLAK